MTLMTRIIRLQDTPVTTPGRQDRKADPDPEEDIVEDLNIARRKGLDIVERALESPVILSR